LTALTEQSTQRSIRVRDININYHEAGAGSEAVILLHGAGPGASAWSNFRRTLGPLAARYRTLAIDMPHFGKSDRPAGHRHDPVFYSAVVLDVMDALHVDRAHFVGNSMGGVVSLRVALDAPERADRLVLMGTAGSLPLFTPSPTQGQRLLAGYYAPPGPSLERMQQFLSVMLHDQTMVTDELVRERYDASIANRPSEPPVPGGMGAVWREVDRVEHKTLIVWGKEDRVVPLDAAFVLLRLMRNADLHVFANSGHWAQNERADDFNAVVLAFLTKP